MDVKHTLHSIHFEWDQLKASVNLRKHGISFEEVIDDEVREAAVGMTIDWRLLYVVYVFREELVRIISARLVTKTERKQYEAQ